MFLAALGSVPWTTTGSLHQCKVKPTRSLSCCLRKMKPQCHLHWSKQQFMVPRFWGLHQPLLKTKHMSCRLNTWMAVAIWELAACCCWGLERRRYLVSVLIYLTFKNERVFWVRGFEHCCFNSCFASRKVDTEDFKSRTDNRNQVSLLLLMASSHSDLWKDNSLPLGRHYHSPSFLPICLFPQNQHKHQVAEILLLH